MKKVVLVMVLLGSMVNVKCMEEMKKKVRDYKHKRRRRKRAGKFCQEACILIQQPFGSVKQLEDILKGGVDIDARSSEGKTLLHEAVAVDRLECVTSLIKYCASVKIKDNDQLTVWHYAIKKNKKRIFEYFLKTRKQDIKTIKTSGLNLLEYVAFLNKQSFVPALLKFPFLYQTLSCQAYIINAFISHQNLPMIQYLLTNYFNMQCINDPNQSPLHTAVKKRNYAIVKYLLDNGVDGNSTDEFGKIAADYALAGSNIAELLEQRKFGR